MKVLEVIDFLKREKSSAVLRIKGKDRKALAMSDLRTLNMGDDGYFKIMFTDGSFLLIIPSMKAFYFAEKLLGLAEGVKDEDIGVVKELEFNSKKYVLDNKDDYQYVQERIFGSFEDIEGEVRFSDYVPKESPESEILSLGWIVYTNERADVNPYLVDESEISLGEI